MLQHSVSQVCSHLSLCPSILNITFQKIKATTKFLLGKKPSYIFKDIN